MMHTSMIEVLEDRRLFAKLTLTATAHSDSVALDVKNTRIWYTLNGVTQKLRAPGVAVVIVQLGNGNDKLTLGAFAPPVYIDAGIGDDTVNGAMGLQNQTLLGGNGNDSLSGGLVADRIDGGYGNDTITGGPGLDTLIGSFGIDRITANDGETDSIDGGPDTDTGFLDVHDAFDGIEIRHYS